jgi:ATP-dependent exoDNAse (exonuclease V) alpha subunit
LDKLAAIGAIHEVGYLDRPRAVAEAYLASGPDALLACTTHEEIARVTHEVRRLRKQSGQLTDAHAGERYVPLNWTDAQKDEMANYRPGHVLVFHKPTVNTQNHEAVEITRVDKNAIWGRREDGKEIKLTAKQAGAFTVHAKEDIEVASGDVLLLQSSWHGELRFTNGERVTVASIDSNGNKTLTDGRVLPARYKQFNHGYAVTIHVAQGKTVDHVIVAADEMPTELFYVGTTRGRYRCEVYTGDLETLRDSVVQSDARNSATDLAMRLRARSVAQQAQEFYGQPDLHRDAEQSRASTPVHTAEANHAELEAVLD